MRLDKYLKVTRIVKRREVAHDFIEQDRCFVNDKLAKPSTNVKENDIILLNISPTRQVKIKVLKVAEFSSIKDSKTMYEILED